MSESFEIRKYCDLDAINWDRFVFSDSINGTFLQSRRFLSYHPQDRFIDNSYILYDKKGHIVAICPACIRKIENGQMLDSHSGSTFGGLVIGKKYYSANNVIEIIRTIENKCLEDNINEIRFKITPFIFSKLPPALLEYCLYYCGYQEQDELNLYIDYSDYKENIASNYKQFKRTHVNKCIREGMRIKKIIEDSDILTFYALLKETLAKYNLNPVHSYEELIEFKNRRLKDECSFYGVYLGNELLAGSMMFFFNNVKVAHTQYMCSSHDYDQLSPMTFIYHSLIEEMRNLEFEKISFGISSEHTGKILNFGLTASKEAYGSKHDVNRIYSKKLMISSMV